jgi:putative ABC transport system substrate-binding protein
MPFDQLKRREFITLLGGAAAGWPVAARAQQARPVIGFLDGTAAAPTAYRLSAFRQGLSETSFIEGRNVAIEYRWAEGRFDRLPALAADLVRRRVAVIVASAGGITVAAAKAATSTIPIVFVFGGDPVGAGLVASLNRPGGNVTGVSISINDLEPKRLQLLHEIAPKPSAIAVLHDPNATMPSDYEAAGRAIGRQILVVTAVTESDIDAAFAKIVQAGAGALFVGAGAFYSQARRQIVALAARHGLPASYPLRESVLDGGLMSYGADVLDAYRRTGVYVGRILKGEKPADLPVELPTKIELVINLATAKALGLTVPVTLQLAADEVIE